MTEQKTGGILFVGDMHLGRRPVGLDVSLAGLSLTAHDLSPATALTRVVDEALASEARAVVFAGDLVDQDKDRFEAYPILERQVQRLADQDIPVFAVAGNHDSLVLPRLIERVPWVSLLGEGGTWERVEVPGPGPAIDLLGWSFPKRHFATCPLDTGDFAAAKAAGRDDALTLGVLHCDLDAVGSRYAPVSRSRLREAGLDGWFLGHVHQPGDLTAKQPIGYLGSLVGLDIGETGPRGPWRVNTKDGALCAEQLALGPVRWETYDVDLSLEPTLDVDTVHAAIEREVHARLEEDATITDQVDLLVVRVRLVGRVLDRRGVREFTAMQLGKPFTLPSGATKILVQRVRDATRTVIDLAELAQEPTAIGRVATHLVALQAGQATELLASAARDVARVQGGGWQVDDTDHPLPETRELLMSAAWRVLDVLLEQRDEGAGA